MSSLDKELLKAAGLRGRDIAPILGRNLQAIYTGLSARRTYFKPGEIALFIHELIRRDSAHIGSLVEFVEAKYSPQDCDLILPERVSRSQLMRAAEGSGLIVMGFNGNIEHLNRAASFAKVFLWALKAHRVALLTQHQWVQNFVSQAIKPQDSCRYVVSPSYTYPLPFALLVQARSQRVFFFGRLSVGEGDPGNAAQLWGYVHALLGGAF
jgi:hypothetical protein